MKANEVKEKIQDLINKKVSQNEEQKKQLNFLFRKLDEIKELETIDQLRQFPNGNKYLQAYLLYKSISRANYQPELTQIVNFADENGSDKFLEAINADLDLIIKHEKPQPREQPTTTELLNLVAERVKAGKIAQEDLLELVSQGAKTAEELVVEMLKKRGLK